ncbi:hypothetical protein [Paenibacillus sacheonensis]|uniref:Beta-galactosidase trimerisation domain-containing protein n=1 Tax=Paenibacillus sacheonensis TaxID=742054 RepID=A0A7X4YPR0_9BACL|nr:hypothetical protein [Paenibacillus sacheonensis]MBM7564790.1 hypothetical protein [Paenibacillus sacheonensis]NBC69339.1 hypothetical protein [Paenibacillus sacheonensis]
MSRKKKANPEWTGFQESRPYGTKYDLRADFVMVYGIGNDLPARIEGWKEAGYTIHLMTGVSWGEYQDYLYGKFDGRDHWDEAQTIRDGSHMLHGKDVPYMVPTISFAEYLATYIKKAIDCGIEAIHMEEPEFWAQSGYEEAFKREWLNYYGEDWIPPHVTPDAQYRASKLKAAMYYRALDRICSQMKEYALVTYGRTVRFYVPTHSLINYTQWRIVSPEALLVSMPSCDGFIAQIWTGTARTPNVYKGVRRERTFETAYLEYGIMQELTRGTGREMWFLHDPIEDNPRYAWSDYRFNYRQTVVASLLHPGVSQYEVCPWPWRVFSLPYPREDGTGKETIPGDYATVLLTVMNVLRDMHNHEEVDDGTAYTRGIGLCLANSAMYQRGDVIGEDDGREAFKYDGTESADKLSAEQRDLLDWSAFYGLALPLVKSGVPLRPVQLDNILTFPGYMDDYRVLLLSYEFMKPEHPGIHQALGQWVRDGGVLIYVGDGTDPFHEVSEWWNRGAGSKTYDRAEEHLFESLGLGREPEQGEHVVGRGAVMNLRVNPAALARTAEGAERVTASIKRALEIRGEAADYRESGVLRIQRGPYVIAQALDETGSDAGTELPGTYLDLLEADLPVRSGIVLKPGDNCLLYDMRHGSGESPAVLASSSRVRDEERDAAGFRYVSESPSDMTVSTRIRLSKAPSGITADGKETAVRYDAASGTLLVRHASSPKGVRIVIAY